MDRSEGEKRVLNLADSEIWKKAKKIEDYAKIIHNYIKNEQNE
jgi:hypothetical protein